MPGKSESAQIIGSELALASPRALIEGRTPASVKHLTISERDRVRSWITGPGREPRTEEKKIAEALQRPMGRKASTRQSARPDAQAREFTTISTFSLSG